MSTFKRDTDLIEKANAVLSATEINDDARDVIRDLVKKYESTTYKEHSDRHEFYADIVSDMTNDYGFKDEELADKMANEHPTLQQSFMRFVVKFIKKMANKEYYDGRNERSVMLAKKMATAMEDSYLPMI